VQRGGAVDGRNHVRRTGVFSQQLGEFLDVRSGRRDPARVERVLDVSPLVADEVWLVQRQSAVLEPVFPADLSNSRQGLRGPRVRAH